MNCPVCKAELKALDRQGIEIDACPQCRGVWLDRGELEKIIERTVGEGEGRGVGAPTHPGRQSHRDHDDDHHHDDDHDRHGYGRNHGNNSHRKRKSLLGELFDF
ncbi:MAG: zf-TFIIB domain-containing protein [Candidatus Latescibacteria bacterium]|nr:zf-TFIIB domain-containing protein [Candidatus Latescibacterota bacterium]